MKLSTKGRYAVMAMVDLATHASSAVNAKPIALADIAERQEISLSYLEQLFGRLRRGQLVKSVRGPGGNRHSRCRRDLRGRRADQGDAMYARKSVRVSRQTAALSNPRFVGRARQSDLFVFELGLA